VLQTFNRVTLLLNTSKKHCDIGQEVYEDLRGKLHITRLFCCIYTKHLTSEILKYSTSIRCRKLTASAFFCRLFRTDGFKGPPRTVVDWEADYFRRLALQHETFVGLYVAQCYSRRPTRSVRLLDKLQSVLNAAARLVCSGRKYDHITPLLCDLHWLPFPERTTFCLTVLAYRCQHGLAPSYRWNELHRVADVHSRRWLRSAMTTELLVPRTVLTVSDRVFPVAAAHAWNELPSSAMFAPSLLNLKLRIRTALFSRSFTVDWQF